MTKSLSNADRLAVWSRDSWHCRYCRAPVFFAPTLKLMEELCPGHGYYHPNGKTGAMLPPFQWGWAHVGHIQAVSRGGTGDAESLVTACWRCISARRQGADEAVGAPDPVPEHLRALNWDGLSSLYPKLAPVSDQWCQLLSSPPAIAVPLAAEPATSRGPGAEPASFASERTGAGTAWRPAGALLPEGLTPLLAQEIRLPSGRVVPIPRASTRLTPWPAGEVTIDDFGGKPVVDFRGEQTFAEIALLRMFQASGWQARWLETYNAPNSWPFVLDRWHPAGIKAREIASIEDSRVVDLLKAIIARNDNRCAGCWDVVAWRDSTLVFAEAKRAKKDRLQDTQRLWVDASLDIGLSAGSFLIVEWQF